MAQFSNDLRGENFPAWKQLYEAAILEFDYRKLLLCIDEARSAIQDREAEALTSSSLAEHHALNNALRTLQILEEVAEREKYAA